MHVHYLHNTTVLPKCEQGNIATVKLLYVPTHAENLHEYAETCLEENITGKG